MRTKFKYLDSLVAERNVWNSNTHVVCKTLKFSSEISIIQKIVIIIGVAIDSISSHSVLDTVLSVLYVL